MTMVSIDMKAKLLGRLKQAKSVDICINQDLKHRYSPFPMTDMQQAYWLGRNSEMSGGDVAMHLYLEFGCEYYDVDRLEKAINQVITRHDMLRAVVIDSEYQKVLEKVPLMTVELKDYREDNHKLLALKQLRQTMAHRKSDLTQWPQNQIVVTQLHDKEYRLHLSLDLWCIDGRSYQILLKEFAHCYQHGNCHDMKQSALTFRDYVIHQQSANQSKAAFKAKAYWEKRLATLPSAPLLPVKRENTAKGSFKRFLMTLSLEQTQKLTALAQQYGVTTSSVLMTIYSQVLSKWSGERHFTLNIPRFNRLASHPHINDVIGEFATFTLLEVELTPGLSFSEQVKVIQNQLMSDIQHPSVSGMEMLRALTKKHGSVVSMPIVFTASPDLGHEQQQFESDIAIFGEVTHAISQTPQVDLDCQYFMLKGQLNVNWDAVEEKFEQGIIEAMFEEFKRLLAAISSSSDWENVIETQLPVPQQNLWNQINTTSEDFELIDWHQILKQHATLRPDQPALMTDDETLTWQQLLDKVTCIATNLQQQVNNDDLVALYMPKEPRQIIFVLACVVADLTYLPIDVEAPHKRVNKILAESKATLLISDHYVSEVNFTGVQIKACELEKESVNTLICRSPSVCKPVYVIYTSGSTGTPKGVPILHKGLSNFVHFNHKTFAMSCDDRVMALSAIHHDMSVFDLFSGVYAGATLILPKEDQRRLPEKWVKLSRHFGVTVWNGVPAAAQKLLSEAKTLGLQLPALRLMILGGDWVPMGITNQLTHIAPNCTLFTVGGPTEISVWNIFSQVCNDYENWYSLPYGKPADNCQYLILSGDNELAPCWVSGEMLCKGVGVFDGYLNRPDLNKEAFIIHPNYGCLYRTGDIGRLRPCGNFEFIGRIDNRIKFNGHRIELSEIEQLALNVMGIVHSVAMLVESEHGDKLALCYQINSEMPERIDSELRKTLSESLPVALMPQILLNIDEWPLTENNKIDRHKLLLRLLEGNVGSSPIEGAMQTMLASVWSDLLETEPQHTNDNFFMLGADSITATRLASKLENTFGVSISLAELFMKPTIEQQAILVGNKLINMAQARGNT